MANAAQLATDTAAHADEAQTRLENALEGLKDHKFTVGVQNYTTDAADEATDALLKLSMESNAAADAKEEVARMIKMSSDLCDAVPAFKGKIEPVAAMKRKSTAGRFDEGIANLRSEFVQAERRDLANLL